MGMDEFTATVVIKGEECLYDPKAGVAVIQCERCGHPNHVEVEVGQDGQASFHGFSCENCGAFNAPD